MNSFARLLALTTALAWPAGAWGQNVVTLQYNFSNPGARSLGLGGAFVALADDATAAYANPAGLTQLARPEISIEGRSWSYATTYTEGGRASGEPSGIGIDTVDGIRGGVSEADFTELSFVSFVYPWRRLTFAVYRHQLARFASTYNPQGLFSEGVFPPGTRPTTSLLGTSRRWDQPGGNDLDVINTALAVGIRVTDSLSVGLGVSYQDAKLTFGSAAFLPDDESVEAFFGPNSFLPERLVFENATRVEGTETGLTLGLLWRLADRWRLGAFHREGFAVHASGFQRAGPGAPPGFPDLLQFEGNWLFPEVYGAGIAFQSRAGRLTTSLEWDHVGYSENLSNDPDERIPDADELHLGAEYVFLERTPVLAVRLGTWLDPDHRIQATIDDDLFGALLPPGEDELHVSAGVGVVFERLQIDFAVDLSDPADVASLSAVYSF